MACLKCGKTKQTIEGDEYFPSEEVEVYGNACYDCMRVEREAVSRLVTLAESGAAIIGSAQGTSWQEFTVKIIGTNLKPTPDEIKNLWRDLLTKPNVYKRGTTYFMKRFNEPELEIGTKIWRKVHFSSGRYRNSHEIPKTVFVKTDKSYVAFATRGGSWGHVWEGFHLKPGMACFSSIQIPDDWTALIVTGFSTNGRSAFVKPYVGTTDELLDAHKKPCDKRGTRRAINESGPCPVCREREEAKIRAEGDARRAQSAQLQFGYVPRIETTAKSFICRACMPKAPRGSGKCVMCKKDYA